MTQKMPQFTSEMEPTRKVMAVMAPLRQMTQTIQMTAGG